MQKIYHDLFHIAERILQIDPFYEIFWNEQLNRFEVFWHGKLAFVVPFDALDVRTLQYTQRTRRENADDIAAKYMGKALRKMRHPSVSKEIRSYVEFKENDE